MLLSLWRCKSPSVGNWAWHRGPQLAAQAPLAAGCGSDSHAQLVEHEPSELGPWLDDTDREARKLDGDGAAGTGLQQPTQLICTWPTSSWQPFCFKPNGNKATISLALRLAKETEPPVMLRSWLGGSGLLFVVTASGARRGGWLVG